MCRNTWSWAVWSSFLLGLLRTFPYISKECHLGSNFVYDDNDMYSLFIFFFHSGGVIGQTFTSKYSVLIYKHWALYGMYVAHITIYCTSECPATCTRSIPKVSVLIFYLNVCWTHLKLQVISFKVWPLGSYTVVPFFPLIIAVLEVIFRKCI